MAAEPGIHISISDFETRKERQVTGGLMSSRW